MHEISIAEQKEDIALSTHLGFGSTPTGLIVTGSPTLQDWQAYGEAWLLAQDATPWIIGDWMLYGQETYGDEYANAIELTGAKYDTVSKYKWVAKHVPQEVRRHPRNIAWTYHKHVAHLPPDRQDFLLGALEAQRAGREPEGCNVPPPILDNSANFRAWALANEEARSYGLTVKPDDPEKLHYVQDAEGQPQAVVTPAGPEVDPDTEPEIVNHTDEPEPEELPEQFTTLLPPCPVCHERLRGRPDKCPACGATFADLVWLLHDLTKEVDAMLNTGEMGPRLQELAAV